MIDQMNSTIKVMIYEKCNNIKINNKRKIYNNKLPKVNCQKNDKDSK